MEGRTQVGLIKAMAWSGVLLVVALAASYALMGFLPPPSPALPAEAIKAIFVERAPAIRIGTMIECIGYTFYLTWAMSIVIMLRRMEAGLPVISWTSMANAGGGYVLFLIQPLTWAALAYRPDLVDAWFLQIMNDWVWFTFILSWPPFALFMVMIGIAILTDHNSPRIMPRWVAFINFWCALAISPAALIEFFKTGPFTYAGAIDFWFIFVVFFGWMVVMTVVTVKAASSIAGIETART
jgi:hypothetical protein